MPLATGRPVQVPFHAHLELLHFFLAHRADIVERIQGLLNAQRKPIEYLRDGAVLSRHFEDCFYIGVTEAHSRFRGQLEDAHWASGFRPREIPGLHNGLIEPAELMVRAFHMWQQTHWPGRNGRVHYAHTLFNLYVIRCLELLAMRIWDDESSNASDRLSQVQGVLDQLWRTAPSNQPVLVRDARWLIQMAQSPATDDLGAYFLVSERVASSLSREDGVETHKAGVRMTGGHLRSQIRYHAVKKAVALDEASLVLNTRNTNALDFALLIQELVPLLETYQLACDSDDSETRIALADAICQGISPDPELFLNRIDLLGAYSMIEHLFITTDEDDAIYTSMGQRHVELIRAYEALISRVSKFLADDCPRFRPVADAYSPFGALYGFSTDLIEHMAFKSLQPDAVTRFGVEDVFVAGDAEKLAWVTGWRKLPHLTSEVQKLFDYPQQFAEDVFDRIERALRRRVSGEATVQTGRLFLVDDPSDAKASDIPDLPIRYIASSDDEHILSDRVEGRCLLSYQTADGWVAISKSVLTEVLGEGHDAKIVGLPTAAAAVLKLMCPTLIAR